MIEDAHPTPDSRTILIVDDQPHVRTYLRARLRRALPQVELIEAGSASEALSVLKLREIDVIVSDFSMPGMDGGTLLTQVQRLAPTVARVLITGQSDLDIATRAVNEGAVHAFFQKPAISETFEVKIRDLLGSRARERGALARPAAPLEALLAQQPEQRDVKPRPSPPCRSSSWTTSRRS
jgi:DNA-binding NtrC family response regulator